MQVVISHVRNDGTTTVTCPVCNRAKRTAIGPSAAYKHNALKARCSCNAVFKVQLNYRSHYRKAVRLFGTYKTVYQDNVSKGAMDISNLSKGGLQYSFAGVNRMQTGSIIALDFELDNRQQTRIKKYAMVRSVNGNIIGCEFVDQDHSDKALAFYLHS